MSFPSLEITISDCPKAKLCSFIKTCLFDVILVLSYKQYKNLLASKYVFETPLSVAFNINSFFVKLLGLMKFLP